MVFFEFRKLAGLSSSDPADDPCLPSGMLANATVNLGATMSSSSAEAASRSYGDAVVSGAGAKLFLRGTGRWKECYTSLSDFVQSREKFSVCDENANKEGKKDLAGETVVHCPDAGMKVTPVTPTVSQSFLFSEALFKIHT